MSNKDAKAGASQPDSSEDEQTSTTQASGKATPERGPPPSPPQSAAQLYGREQCANWAKPDSDLLYLMTGAPPLASSYGGRPAHEPRAVTQTLYDAIQAAYTARNKEVKYHLLNFKVPKNLPRPDRARVTLHQKQIEAAFLKQIGSECKGRAACHLKTWADYIVYWAKNSSMSLAAYLSEDPQEAKSEYVPPVPLPYEPENAMTIKYLPVNIEYNGTTYCVGCRHATYRYDVHYWCMRCTLLAGYWPCTALDTYAVCDLCKRLPSSAKTQATKLWRRLYKDGVLQYAAIAKPADRLPVYVGTHFDSSVVQIILARNRGDDVQPLDPNPETEAAIAKSYTFKLSIPAPTEEDDDDNTTSGRRGSKRRTRPPKRLHTEVVSAEDLRKALAASRLEAGDGQQPDDTTGDDPAHGLDGSSPAKRVHASEEDYAALHLPWNYISKVLRGTLGMDHATYRDQSGTRRGYQPAHNTPNDVYAEMRQLWLGELHVKVAYPDAADTPGSWCLILCDADEVGACDVPLLPCPAKAEAVAVPPRRLTFQPPARYTTIMDANTINWPAILSTRLAASYRPTFCQLNNPDSWSTTFPVLTGVDDQLDIPRRSIALPTMDKTYTWDEITQFSREGLLDLLKADAAVEKIAITSRAFTHDWWRQCAAAGRVSCDVRQDALVVSSPLLAPYSSPDDPTIHRNATRPELPDAPDLPDITQAFGSLSVTAKVYLVAREQEQAEFLLATKDRHLLQTTYRSRRMRVPVMQFHGSSDANFPTVALPPPDVAAWAPRLATPVDSFTAYPITDLTMRYMEELARAHMYQTSHREHAFQFIDRDLQDLLEIVTLVTPTYRRQALRIVSNTLGRLWNLLLDDVALTAELVMTIIHARRQGFLSLCTADLTDADIRYGLAQRIVNAPNVLVPPPLVPALPNPSGRPSALP